MGGQGSSLLRNAVRWKVSRLRSGEAPRVLDLFAGCGGMSLGARLAGCEIAGAIELDPVAAASHAQNFHGGDQRHAQPRDICRTDAHSLARELGFSGRNPMRWTDVIVGGPPCQAFARVGRAKLREIMAHPEAFLHDERSGLYRHFLRFVQELAPVAVIVENVPDVLNYGGLNVFDVIAGALDDSGYDCAYGLMNAAHYGVPQMRMRCFLVGVARVAKTAPLLPRPTHHQDLPVGYRGTRAVAVRHMRALLEKSAYVELKAPSRKLPAAVTAREAIGDLPPITCHLRGLMRKAPQRLDSPIPTPASSKLSAYAQLMRRWPGFESSGFVLDHVIRFLPRDYRIFRRMQAGDQYPEAHLLARQMFEEVLSGLPDPPRKGAEEYRQLMAMYVPPYNPGKFPNKWRKMEADQPARTLMAHIGKDTYSHIHYDSQQARTISVREAARLQSFPDGFRFCGTMNPAFRQIGNAVPPLMGYSVISCLLRALGVDVADGSAAAG